MRGLIEAEAFEDTRRPRRGIVRFNVDEARVDLGDALRIARGFRFGHQRLALDVGGKHKVDKAFAPAGPPGRRCRCARPWGP